MAVGIRPEIALAEAAGLHCERGIVVDDTLLTFDPRIYAVGECVQHRGKCYGLVAPLFEMAKVAANHLAHHGIGRYVGSVTATKLKVTGIDLFSAGDFMGGEGADTITLSDPVGGVYKRLVLQDHRIVGACLYGDTVDGSWYFKMMRDARDVAELREHLMFGEANLGDTGHAGAQRAQTLADTAEVCGCNGVCKGTISQGDQGQGPLHAGGRAPARQGLVVLRLVHRPGRAAARGDGRRRLRRGPAEEGGVRLHRPLARGSAPGHPRAPAHDHSRCLRVLRVALARRLRDVPAGGELLPDLDLAARGAGRPAVARW